MRGFTPIPFLLVGLIWAELSYPLLASGLILALAGESLRIWALRHAGGATRTRNVGAPGLVTSGPYGRVRNPLYLANMMLYSGFALASGAFIPYFPILAFLFFAWQYAMIIMLEETTLKRLFGEAYGDYCAKVPRLCPSLQHRGERRAAPYPLSEALRQERSTILGLALSWVLLTLRIAFLPPTIL